LVNAGAGGGCLSLFLLSFADSMGGAEAG